MTAAYDLVDDFGRHTKFEGEVLTTDSTDTADRRKPQWTETTIYRTVGGRYVVWTESNYRVRHISQNCTKVTGYDLIPARPEDTWACPKCNPGDLVGGWGQDTRTKVDICETPQDLVNRLSTVDNTTGLRTHSQYAQALLADISDLDDAVRAIWMEQVVL